MSTRKVASVGSSDIEMIKLACSRQRARCTHDTCYDHSNLAAYVQSALGNTWQIVLPPALGVSRWHHHALARACSNFFNPRSHGRKSNLRLSFLSASASIFSICLPVPLRASGRPVLTIRRSDASIDLVAQAFGISRIQAADCICGHCETAAVALSGNFCILLACL